MHDDETARHTLHEDRRQGAIDKMLKRMMPNGTVMRRFIAGSWTMKIILGTVLILLIERTDDNANRSARAVCAVKEYTDRSIAAATPEQIAAAPGGFALFKELQRDLRKVSVRCDPPRVVD